MTASEAAFFENLSSELTAFYIQNIPGNLACMAISVAYGKIVRIDLHLIQPDYFLAVTSERGTTNRRLVWILKEYRSTFGT